MIHSAIVQSEKVGQAEPVVSVIVRQVLVVKETGGLVVCQQRTLVDKVARTTAR